MARRSADPELHVSWEQARAFRLRRMHLVEPVGARSLRKVVRNLGGVQAQVASAAELQCAVRMAGLPPGRCDRALHKERTLVKTWMMRGTLHWIDADDFPVWAAASSLKQDWRQPTYLRSLGVSETEIDAAVEVVVDVLDGKSLTREELAATAGTRIRNPALQEYLRSGWGSGPTKIAASLGLLCFGAPRGRNVTFVRPDQWVPGWKKVDPDAAIVEVARRYFASHAPASRDEFARWWGFRPASANPVIAALGDELAEVDREGERAYVLRRDVAALESASEDDEVRTLPMFDAYVLAGLPHNAVVEKTRKADVYRKGAWVSQTVLRGGRVIGVWTHEAKPRGTVVDVTLFDRRAATSNEIEGALERLRSFIGAVSRVNVAT